MYSDIDGLAEFFDQDTARIFHDASCGHINNLETMKLILDKQVSEKCKRGLCAEDMRFIVVNHPSCRSEYDGLGALFDSKDEVTRLLESMGCHSSSKFITTPNSIGDCGYSCGGICGLLTYKFIIIHKTDAESAYKYLKVAFLDDKLSFERDFKSWGADWDAFIKKNPIFEIR